MQELCRDKNNCAMSVRALRSFTSGVQAKAMEYIPEDERLWFRSRLPEPQRCCGQGEEPCVFAQTEAGGPSLAEGPRLACLWCSPEELAERCASEAGLAQLWEALRGMQPAARCKAILERVPCAARSRFEDQLSAEDEGAIYAQWGQDHLAVALNFLDAALSTREHEDLVVDITDLRDVAEGIPATVLRLVGLAGMPEMLGRMKIAPTRERTMELLTVLQKVAAAAATAQRRERAASAGSERPSSSATGVGKRPLEAKSAEVAGEKVRKRARPKAAFVLSVEDEDEEEVQEEEYNKTEDEGAVYALWDRDHLRAALETLGTAVSTSAAAKLPLTVVELQTLVDGIPASVLRLAKVDSIVEALRRMKNMPKREKAMKILVALEKVAATAARRQGQPAPASQETLAATSPLDTAVGQLRIRRLTSLDSISDKDPIDGVDVTETDTISDVVGRVFATLGLEGALSDFNFRRVELVTEGGETRATMIPVDGSFKALEAKEIILCRKGG
jgi:hypothetical protein